MISPFTIPFKEAKTISMQPIKNYLHKHVPFTPSTFSDVEEWERVREAAGDRASNGQVDAALLYCRYLQDIVRIFPNDILTFAYTSVLSPCSVTSTPSQFSSLAFERASIVFNLAVSFSHLAEKQDTSTSDGIAQACSYYQKAAGCILFLNTLESLQDFRSASQMDSEVVLEFSEQLLIGLQQFMVAQAQQSAWRKAIMCGLKNKLVSKLAMKVSSLYGESLQAMKAASSEISHCFLLDWIQRIEGLQSFFEAAAHHTMSLCEFDAARYGHQIAHLQEALILAGKALSTAAACDDNGLVVDVIKAFVSKVKADLVQTNQENQVIYYAEVPAHLPPLEERLAVKVDIPAELQDSEQTCGRRRCLFEGLLGIGAQKGIDDYELRKSRLVERDIRKCHEEMQREVERTLNELCLPEVLNNRETVCTLSPDLLRKIEQVQCDGGLSMLDNSMLKLEALSTSCSMEQLKEMLNNEALEIGMAYYQSAFSMNDSNKTRSALNEQLKYYERVAHQCRERYEALRCDWGNWKTEMIQLMTPIKELKTSLHRSVAFSDDVNFHVLELGALLEQLEASHQSCILAVDQAQHLAKEDNIRSVVSRTALAHRLPFEMQPHSLLHLFEKQLKLYDGIVQAVQNSTERRADLLKMIKHRRNLFISAQFENYEIKEHETGVKSLELAYRKYQEILQRLKDGTHEYEDLERQLSSLKESCRTWSRNRLLEIHARRGTLDDFLLQKESL